MRAIFSRIAARLSGRSLGSEGEVQIDLDPEIDAEASRCSQIIERDRYLASLPQLPRVPQGAWVHMASNKSYPGFPGGDDCATAWNLEDGGTAALVADGSSGGDEGYAASRILADFLVRKIRTFCSHEELAILLLRGDEHLREFRLHSDTTAVLAVKKGPEIALAAQGDSHAFAVTEHDFNCLTDRQARKPRVGSGLEIPPFSLSCRCSGMIVLGSDGVFPSINSAASRIAAVRAHPQNPALAIERDVLTGRTGYPDDFSVVVLS